MGRNREILVRGIASDHVAEILFGTDWLETQGAIRDLTRDPIYIYICVVGSIH